MSNINGVGNSFSATIDGLNSFELSSLTVDEIDAGTINVETEIFTPIVVLKDGVNTTTMSQSGLQTIIQNDENLGTMTFNCKGPFGANVQSLTLSYLTTTVNTSVLQVNGRVQPNSIRFPDGVTVGDKVVYLRGADIYKDYKVTFRNSPDDTGDLFYNIPVGYAHTFSYGDTSYVNILSIRSNGDILYTDITGNKITYYTGYSTEIATNILRHIVPSSASHRFKVGTTDIMTIDSSGVNVLVTTGNIALKDAANTFTLTNTFPQINFTDVVGTKLQYYTGYTTEIQTSVLRRNVPTSATHRFAVNSVDMMIVSANQIDVNPTNNNNGVQLKFYTHSTTVNRNNTIGYTNGAGMLYKTGGVTNDKHLFRIATPTVVDICSFDATGITLLTGNLLMNVGDIRFPATATTKIQYYGAGGGYSTEVAAGILRQISPSQHIWKIGATDVLTLSATSLTCEEVIYAKNALRTDDALFLYDQTIAIPVNRSRLYHYNTNLYIDNKTIGGLTFIQAADALGNAVDIFEVNIDECSVTAPYGLLIRNGTGQESNIFSADYGIGYLEIRNNNVSGITALATLDASSNLVYSAEFGPASVLLYGITKIYQDYIVSNPIFETTISSVDIHTSLNIDTGFGIFIYDDPLEVSNIAQIVEKLTIDNQTTSGIITFLVRNATPSTVTPLTLDSTNATLGGSIDLQMSGTGIINQVGSGTNVLKNTDVSGNLTVTGSVTFPTIANVAYVNASQTFTATNTFTQVVNLDKTIRLPTTYTTKTSGQLGYIADGTGNTTATTFVSGTVYSLASLALPVGDWMIYGEACYAIVTAATISLEEISIAPGVALITDAYTRTINPNGAVGSPIRQIFYMVNVTVATTYHVTVAITYSAGSVQRTFASGAQCRIKATRIA